MVLIKVIMRETQEIVSNMTNELFILTLITSFYLLGRTKKEERKVFGKI